MLRFNAGGPVGHATHQAPGRGPALTDEPRAHLAKVVETGQYRRRIGFCS